MADELLTISAFGRRVGLTPSALRFYDDCGLLRPAEVDNGNGYRYYAPEQEPRAALLRDLREIDLPLTEVRVVLDGGPTEAAQVVTAHLRTVEGKADAARRAAARILSSLPAVPYECGVTLGGPELASAIRQVAAAAAPTDEIPALACVLLELGEDEVTLVATDRYQLSIRKLQPHGFTGYPRNLLVRAVELTALARWAAAALEVRIETGPTGTALVRDGEARDIPVITQEFPAYQSILEGLAPPVCRVVLDRLKLAELLTNGTVALDIEPGSLTVTPLNGSAGSDGSPQSDGPARPDGPAQSNGQGLSDGSAQSHGLVQPDASLQSDGPPRSDGSSQLDRPGRLDAICSGSAIRLGFDAGLLTAALTASVGPDVLLEIAAPDLPVVVRSADQGTFTTLVMPTRLDG